MLFVPGELDEVAAPVGPVSSTPCPCGYGDTAALRRCLALTTPFGVCLHLCRYTPRPWAPVPTKWTPHQPELPGAQTWAHGAGRALRRPGPARDAAASPWRRGRAALRARLPEPSGPSHPFPARRWGSVRPGKHRDCERSARCFAGAQVGSERAALNGSVPQRWENFWSWLEAVLNGHLQWAGFLLSQNRRIVRVGRHRSGSNAP